MNEPRKFHGKLVVKEDLGLWEGDVAPILDEADEVDIRWRGGKIPARILWECLTWFRKVNEKYSSEAQARLGYNPATREWCWTAFPQYVVAGLYSKEIPDDELTDEQRAMRLRATREMAAGGFMEAGTIHSHCDAGAFASGTDDKDEITQNGVHITLGEISSEHPEIHGRVVFRKIKYRIHWEDWLEAIPADTSEHFHFNVQDASIDEERLMGLCFERPKSVLADSSPSSGTKWSPVEWRLGGRTGLNEGQSGWAWDEWGAADWDRSAGGNGQRRFEDFDLEDFADRVLEELLYGGEIGGEPLEFIGLFVRRLAELELYAPKDLVSAVVEGILEGFTAAQDKSAPKRETATEP